MKTISDDKSTIKAVRKLLMDLDADDLDMETVAEIKMDFDYIGTELHRRGRTKERDMLFKDGSKVHIFPSRYQRSFEFDRKLVGRPVWTREDLVPANRWTSVQSLTRPSEAADKIGEMENNWEIVRDEGLALAENLTENGWDTDRGNTVADGGERSQVRINE